MVIEFPQMFVINQHYATPRRLKLAELIGERLPESLGSTIYPGMRIAVGVGSRGIANLREIVFAVLATLRDLGAEPFIVPAMGSHGGGTPAGQQKVLAEFGITPEATGVPFETSMEVRQIGQFLGGYPVVCSSAALRADGILPINRVKPHTDFFGDWVGSGVQKMLAIGFGKHVGALNAHKAASELGHETVIRETAKVLLDRAPVLGGVAIVEDQHHQTFDIAVLRPSEIVEEERKLFHQARALLPRLPFPLIDLLIIDEIGKEISGTGMDTNVIGRDVQGYVASLRPSATEVSHISRIFVRDLTAATNGNGIGIGLADFTTTRAVRSLNLDYIYTNALTSLGLATAKIPIHFESDGEVLEKAVATIATIAPKDLRIVRIRNTLSLDRMLVSEPLTRDISAQAALHIEGEGAAFQFDSRGDLLPF